MHKESNYFAHISLAWGNHEAKPNISSTIKQIIPSMELMRILHYIVIQSTTFSLLLCFLACNSLTLSYHFCHNSPKLPGVWLRLWKSLCISTLYICFLHSSPAIFLALFFTFVSHCCMYVHKCRKIPHIMTSVSSYSKCYP